MNDGGKRRLLRALLDTYENLTGEIVSLNNEKPKLKNSKSIADITIKAVSDYTGETVEDILSVRKTDDLVIARMLCANLLLNFGFSLVGTGRVLNRNHASIINLKEKFRSGAEYQISWYESYHEIRDKILQSKDYESRLHLITKSHA